MSAPALLYLDTARLGQMSEMAQRLSTAFIRLSAEEPFNLYFEDFMRNGFVSWPESYQRRFPELSGWEGIESVRNGIRSIAGASTDTEVILASRSLWLVRCAAQTAFRVCRRILTTDLSWPSYQEVLRQEAIQSARDIHCVPIRHRILYGNLSERELIDMLTAAFRQHQCDGIFLPAVDNFGIRLPIEKIVTNIENRSDLRFVFTDAAQGLAHVPLDQVCRVSDCVVAGCHKWVRAYQPLGIGLVCRERHASMLARALQSQRTDDPLFCFLDCLECDRLADHLETVNLTPLFSCRGAIQELARMNVDVLVQRLSNGALVRDLADIHGWTTIVLAEQLRSGIQLLKAPQHVAVSDLKRALHEAEVRATVYETGLLRFSLPAPAFAAPELEAIRNALCPNVI